MENEITLGQTLARARKNSSMDIRELSQKTKINVKILESLENNSLEHLPKPIYVKGFIRILAKTLRIEEKQLFYKQGEVIGYSGSTGIGPPHLHFELRTADFKGLGLLRNDC
jgi:ribosome-binding protein aMBF1 (putative translation factor)